MADAFSHQNGQALVRAKKTFLEFKFFPSEDSDRVRRGSAPSCLAKAHVDEETEVAWISEVSTADGCDHVLWASEGLASVFDVDEIAMPEDLEEETNETDAFVCDVDELLRILRASTGECCNRLLQAPELPNANSSSVQENALELESCTELAELEGPLLMTTKNTFLEFVLAANEDQKQFRRFSSLACFGTCGADEDMSMAGGSAMDSCDQAQCNSEGVACLLHADEYLQASAETPREEYCKAEDDEVMSTLASRKSTSKTKRDKIKHCKGKRVRFQKFLLRLFKQFEVDPEGFNVDLIVWPPSLIEDSECKEIVLNAVTAHRAKALRELAGISK